MKRLIIILIRLIAALGKGSSSHSQAGVFFDIGPVSCKKKGGEK